MHFITPITDLQVKCAKHNIVEKAKTNKKWHRVKRGVRGVRRFRKTCNPNAPIWNNDVVRQAFPMCLPKFLAETGPFSVFRLHSINENCCNGGLRVLHLPTKNAQYKIFFYKADLVHHGTTSSSSLPSFLHSKSLGSVLPWTVYPGESVHLVRH